MSQSTERGAKPVPADDSEVIIHTDGATEFRGPDATQYYQVCALIAGLRMYLVAGLLPNRAWTRNAMLSATGRLTQQDYPGSRAGCERALADLRVRQQNLALSLPTKFVE